MRPHEGSITTFHDQDPDTPPFFKAVRTQPSSYAKLSGHFLVMNLPCALGHADASQIARVIFDALEKGLGDLLAIRGAFQQALGMRI